MCIIIDTNNISRVFCPSNVEHVNYIPVFDWIFKGKGKVVIGGTTFNNEIKKNARFLNLLQELAKNNKLIKVNEQEVNEAEEVIKQLILPHRDFDDPHILALLKVSKCKLICSEDKRAFEYFKSKEIFKNSLPKIYSSYRNRNLLNDSNISDCCKPISVLRKSFSTSLMRHVLT